MLKHEIMLNTIRVNKFFFIIEFLNLYKLKIIYLLKNDFLNVKVINLLSNRKNLAEKIRLFMQIRPKSYLFFCQKKNISAKININKLLLRKFNIFIFNFQFYFTSFSFY